MYFRCPGSLLPVRQFVNEKKNCIATVGAGTYIHGVDLSFNGANSHQSSAAISTRTRSTIRCR